MRAERWSIVISVISVVVVVDDEEKENIVLCLFRNVWHLLKTH